MELSGKIIPEDVLLLIFSKLKSFEIKQVILNIILICKYFLEIYKPYLERGLKSVSKNIELIFAHNDKILIYEADTNPFVLLNKFVCSPTAHNIKINFDYAKIRWKIFPQIRNLENKKKYIFDNFSGNFIPVETSLVKNIYFLFNSGDVEIYDKNLEIFQFNFDENKYKFKNCCSNGEDIVFLFIDKNDKFFYLLIKCLLTDKISQMYGSYFYCDYDDVIIGDDGRKWPAFYMSIKTEKINETIIFTYPNIITNPKLIIKK